MSTRTGSLMNFNKNSWCNELDNIFCSKLYFEEGKWLGEF